MYIYARVCRFTVFLHDFAFLCNLFTWLTDSVNNTPKNPYFLNSVKNIKIFAKIFSYLK